MIRVLIVDDDKLARRGLASLMHWETYGMAVVGEAQNGKNALQFIQEHSVDLVFVDIDMPEMNGIEFMEKCRKIKPDIQFVVLSFFENFSYVQTTLRLGGLDYISKNWTMETPFYSELWRSLSNVLVKQFRPEKWRRNWWKYAKNAGHSTGSLMMLLLSI